MSTEKINPGDWTSVKFDLQAPFLPGCQQGAYTNQASSYFS